MALVIDPKDWLAAERTLLAWIRTGIALMGFGFVVARFGLFLRELARLAGHESTVRFDNAVLGVMVVASGVAMNAWASLRHRHLLRRLRQGDKEIGGSGPMIVGLGTGVGGVILIAALLGAVLH